MNSSTSNSTNVSSVNLVGATPVASSSFSLGRLAELALRTDAQWAPLVARLALGGMILPHAAQKLFGWFGGYGFEGTLGFFTGVLGIPAPLAVAAILSEALGGVLLVTGLGARLGAAMVAGVLGTGAVMLHWQHGFFMNWFGNQAGEGIEFFILALGLAAITGLAGAGRYSLDRVIHARLPQQR